MATAPRRAPWIYDPGDVIDYPIAMRLLADYRERSAESRVAEFPEVRTPLPREAAEVLRLFRRGSRL